MIINLPWPPSINRYWRSNRGRVHISKEGRDYRQAALWQAKQEKWGKFKGEVRVHINMFPPDKRRRDPDNVLKCLFDVLEHAGVVENDCLIKTGSWDWKWVLPKTGAVEVIVENRIDRF